MGVELGEESGKKNVFGVDLFAKEKEKGREKRKKLEGEL